MLAGVALANELPSPTRVSLKKLAAELQLRLHTTPTTASLQGHSHKAILHAASRKLLLDGTLIWMNAGATSDPWTVAAHDAATILRPLLNPRKARRQVTDRPLVVLDPGHGGKSKGAVGVGGIPEKLVVLDIAKRTRRKLQAAGISSKLTRRGDYRLGLQTRVERAAKWDASLFVSIHANYAANRAAVGVETFVPASSVFPSTSGGSPGKPIKNPVDHVENSRLAMAVHREILDHTDATDRGIKRARFTVIRRAPYPALLVECGFLSNAKEEKRLLDKNYRDRIAQGISDGITRYLTEGQLAP